MSGSPAGGAVLTAQEQAAQDKKPRAGSPNGLSKEPKSPKMNSKDASRNIEILTRRVASLESELNDTKRLLLDAVCDKRDLEAQKTELAQCIAELTGNAIAEDDTSEMITDRAKRTMMRLRMERTEGVKQRLFNVVRQKSVEAMGKVRSMKEEMVKFKTDMEDQLQRLGSVIDSGRKTYDEIMAALKKQAQEAIAAMESSNSQVEGQPGKPPRPSSGDSNGPHANMSYIDLVTAAVQQQQKTIVLPPDHPLIMNLKSLLDAVDSLTESLNASWAGMPCFKDGKPPSLLKVRRFVDPMVNMLNYTTRVKTIQNFVEHADLLSLLFADMHLPQLERMSQRMIASMDAKFKVKIDASFDAMRVIRSPGSMTDRSFSNALRLFAAAEGVPHKSVKAIQDQYAQLSKQHTKRCFQYITRMLHATRQFARSEAREGRSLTVEQLFNLLPNPNDPNVADSIRCGQCKMPMVCEDCLSIETMTSDRRHFLQVRRQLILDFTEHRLNHLQELMTVLDDAMLTLRKARVISIQSLHATKIEDFDLKNPLAPRSQSPGLDRSKSPTHNNRKKSPTGRGGMPLHTGIKSSTYYFENLRKHRREMEARSNPIGLRSEFLPSSSSGPLSARIESRPTTVNDQNRFIEDLKFLDKLTPRKPQTANANFRRTSSGPQSARGGSRDHHGTKSSQPQRTTLFMNRQSPKRARPKPKDSDETAATDVQLDPARLGPLIDPSMAASLARAMEVERQQSREQS